MANIHLHIPSFNAGELSPLLGARFAVEKVQSGCRRLRNFMPHVHGPAFRRPGMEFMGVSASHSTKSSLRGFNFSTSTGFVLEFHPSGLRVWSNGLLVPLAAPVDLPYSEAECAEVQLAQVNDVCYLTHPNHRPMKLVRHADDDWRLEEIEWKWPALGDENVRSGEIATPAVSVLAEYPTQAWPQFRMPGPVHITVDIIGSPDLSSTQKVVRLERWNGSDWIEATSLQHNWRAVTPTAKTGDYLGGEATWRVIYNQPFAVGGTARVTWVTIPPPFSGLGIPGGPVDLVMSTPYRASFMPVTVPAGDWQITVECAATIRAGASLEVQKKTGSTWTDFRAIALKPGKVIISEGPKLASNTDFRFLWNGLAMAGAMRFESITYPVVTDLTVAIDGTNGTGRTLTALSPIFRAGHVGSYWQITHRRAESSIEIVAAVPTIAATTSAEMRVNGKWEVYSYGDWAATFFLEQEVAGVWETLRSWKGHKDRNVIANGETDEETFMRLRVSAGTSEAASGAAAPRFTLEASDARVSGIVKIVAVGAPDTHGNSTTATVDVTRTVYSTDATPLWTEGAWSGEKGFPSSLALHGQRLWFGGTKAEPLRLWGSVISDFENFRRSSFDDAGVSFVPAAQQSNRLQWMISHGDNLVLGTSGDEWTISGGSDKGPITPVSVSLQRRSAYGSAFLPAMLMGGVLVFVQRGRSKLREVGPQTDTSEWAASDLTVLAEHVARAGIVQMAAMFFPQSILWAVTTDGKLLGLTFEQEQNVFAWHVHDTDGLVESVAVVYGAAADEVWLAVLRNGKRSIERLDTLVMARQFEDRTRLIYVDAALRFESASPMTQLIGLDHLEGRQVAVLGDGAVLSPARVLNGAVTLEQPVSVAVVGLPFTSELQPMRLELPLRDGTAQHRQWRTSRVGLYVHESLGGEVADGPEGRFERLQYRRVETPMDSAPALYSGEMETAIESRARAGVDVMVRTNEPLPLNVGSITVKGDVYGE